MAKEETGKGSKTKEHTHSWGQVEGMPGQVMCIKCGAIERSEEAKPSQTPQTKARPAICGTCDAWETESATNWGECRANPPILSEGQACFPPTRMTTWCLDHTSLDKPVGECNKDVTVGGGAGSRECGEPVSKPSTSLYHVGETGYNDAGEPVTWSGTEWLPV